MSIGLTDKVSALGNFPAVDDSEIGGGFRVVAAHALRDSIKTGVRTVGMLVKSLDDGIIWQLGADLSTWSPMTSGSSGILPSVSCVSLINVSLTGTDFSVSTWDGYSGFVNGTRVLLPFQTDMTQNGIYYKSGADLVLATDVITTGASVRVNSGDHFGGNLFVQNSLNIGYQYWVSQEGPSFAAPIQTVTAGGGGAWVDWITLFAPLRSNLNYYVMDVTVTCNAKNTSSGAFYRETRSALFKCGSTLTVIEPFNFITAPDSPVLFKQKNLSADSSVTIQVWNDPTISYCYNVSADVMATRVGPVTS